MTEGESPYLFSCDSLFVDQIIKQAIIISSIEILRAPDLIDFHELFIAQPPSTLTDHITHDSYLLPRTTTPS